MTALAAMAGGTSNAAYGHQQVVSTLRGSSSNKDSNDSGIPDFFPTDMKQEDLAKFHKKKHERHSSSASPLVAITNVNKDDWLHQCATTYQKYINPGSTSIQRSNFYLIDEPSGLCADALSCAFDKCYASPGGDPAYDSLLCLMQNTTGLSSTTYDDAASMCNFPPLALPESITFPKGALDVITATNYAKRNEMQISIKSTGHSYTGSHTKSGSLMLNMRDYAKYATNDDVVVECYPEGSNDGNELGDACILAKARGKNAYIRVGGGQTWSEVYNAVNASNAIGNLSNMYGVGGGAAGSVGAAGGWLSGGGLSVGYERTEGLGVDQILELELALPDGTHVRVFPSEWEDVDGYIYPQTTRVIALCNVNVVADESKWDWQPCDNLAVSPEDIWMAVRGGGGGTYAITLSVKYQLFDHLSFQPISFGFSAWAGASTVDVDVKEAYDRAVAIFQANDISLWNEARRIYTMFLVDFMFASEKISVSNDASVSCGSAAMHYQFTAADAFYCWGEDEMFPIISSAWKQTVQSTELAETNPELAQLLSKYLFFDMMAPTSPFEHVTGYGGWQKQWYQFIYPNNDDIFPVDVVPDVPLPALLPSKQIGTFCSVNIPLGLLQSDEEAERDLVFKILDEVSGQHVTGGNVAVAGDGMTAVSPSERLSGQSSVSLQGAIDKYGDDILADYLNAVYKYVGVDDLQSFPGFYEYNHICSDASTPSNSDWAKSCDPEKEGDCFSIQESVWGEKLYAELQEIKSAIDPDNLFDCYLCAKPN